MLHGHGRHELVYPSHSTGDNNLLVPAGPVTMPHVSTAAAETAVRIPTAMTTWPTMLVGRSETRGLGRAALCWIHVSGGEDVSMLRAGLFATKASSFRSLTHQWPQASS